MKCVIDDDVDGILDKIVKADAVVFSVPRYLPIPSKFMSLIERIGALYHYRLEKDPDYDLPLKGKPFGVVVVSAGGGRQALEALKEIAFPNNSLLAYETCYSRYLSISWSFGEGRGNR